MKTRFTGLILVIAWLNMNCGKGIVKVTDEGYEPKIVMEAYLVAGQPVSHIRITRNFPLSQNVNTGYLLPDANKTSVVMTDLGSSRTYPLSFHNGNSDNHLDFWWEYTGKDLEIRPGQSYQMDVWAEIDGNPLHATSRTTVPESDFSVVKLNTDTLFYKQTDAAGNPRFFEITVNRVPGSQCYIAFMKAMDNRVDNFIYENPYRNMTPGDVEEDLDELSNAIEGLVNSVGGVGQAVLRLTWDSFWFYHNYRIVVGAVDKNYADFLITHQDTQELDGNFHEALFHVDGDGIGVFASMVTDTLQIFVKKTAPLTRMSP